MITLECKHCKKTFQVLPYRKNSAICCSRKCLWHITNGKRESARLQAVIGKRASNNAGIYINCITCDISFSISPSRIGLKKFCSKKCFTKKATTSPQRKYKKITVNGKRMLEHRYIMQLHTGRILDPKEHVHHINHDSLDNRIENLQILDICEHARLHARGPY